MAQPIPELHGSGIFVHDLEAEQRERDTRREELIRKFLPLAVATWQDPEVYARFMVDYVGDSNPVLRGLGARPAMVRRRNGVETEFPCEVFSGASVQGDLLHIRAALWAHSIEDYRVVMSDGLKPASDHRLIRFIINPSEKHTCRDDDGNVIEDDSFSLRLRMMDGMATRMLAPTQVPGTERQWVLHVHGTQDEPQNREADLMLPRRTIQFYPIDALHEAILRVREDPHQLISESDTLSVRRLALVHSDQWSKSMPQ